MPDAPQVMYSSYIMSLIRTQISLSDADRSVLDAASRRTGLSMSALIREAIHATYGTPGEADRLRAALEASFGAVVRDEDGAAFVERMRSGRRLAELG